MFLMMHTSFHVDTRCNFSCKVASDIIKTRLHCVTTCAALCSHSEFRCAQHCKCRTHFYFSRLHMQCCTSGLKVWSLIFWDDVCNVTWKVDPCVCAFNLLIDFYIHKLYRVKWCYFLDEYEKLWAAATGGRGTGRGRKKKVQKGVDPEKLKYGRGEAKWEGFNAPIVLEGDQTPKEEERDWEESDGGRRKSWFSRGWSGRTWPGRKVGNPEKPDRGNNIQNEKTICVKKMVRVLPIHMLQSYMWLSCLGCWW